MSFNIPCPDNRKKVMLNIFYSICLWPNACFVWDMPTKTVLHVIQVLLVTWCYTMITSSQISSKKKPHTGNSIRNDYYIVIILNIWMPYSSVSTWQCHPVSEWYINMGTVGTACLSSRHSKSKNVCAVVLGKYRFVLRLVLLSTRIFLVDLSGPVVGLSSTCRVKIEFLIIIRENVSV